MTLVHLSFVVSCLLISFSCSSTSGITLKGIDIENPQVDVNPARPSGSKDALFCERVRVSGISRSKLGSYANSFRIALSPSVLVPERLHSKIEVCFHGNASVGHCQCRKDEWKSLDNGLWEAVMSPYDERYIDVKYIGDFLGSSTITVEEVSQQWRLWFLAVGFSLLLLAPSISNWVHFYYSTSMVIGVFMVIIFLLFQGMKLLPFGRKNFLYLVTLYGSVLGIGSYLFNHFSAMVNSILVNFGISEDMHNLISKFLLGAIILTGAALGFWIGRKLFISKDGTVDIVVAQFAMWAIRFFGITFISQSTLDTPLAIGALISCSVICKFISSLKWHCRINEFSNASGSPSTQKGRHSPEFLSRSSPLEAWNRTRGASAWSDSPVRGVVSPSFSTCNQHEYYSTFHKMRSRKKFTKKEWDDFTRESTRQALAEWAASPEFTNWVIEHADRIKILPNDSSDETVGSESDSTDENVVGSTDRCGFLW
ncbi:uncharacterized protein LOC126788565 [Argentina anserina]|uniref:uncharacterized protein LOC126788565 n=1 Tax=Argentina anserina TaxID=57926 RepID=UPI0021761FAA|nr:uncharacterized protein LOC126788565 [Potentilla anserina]